MTTPLNTERRIAGMCMLMPKDTNHHGVIFGGRVMAEIDLAGAVEAMRYTNFEVVTRYVNGIEFKYPIQVGDQVTLYARLVKLGRTSLTIQVEVEACRPGQDSVISVTAAEVVYVTVQRRGNSMFTVPHGVTL